MQPYILVVTHLCLCVLCFDLIYFVNNRKLTSYFYFVHKICCIENVINKSKLSFLRGCTFFFFRTTVLIIMHGICSIYHRTELWYQLWGWPLGQSAPTTTTPNLRVTLLVWRDQQFKNYSMYWKKITRTISDWTPTSTLF